MLFFFKMPKLISYEVVYQRWAFLKIFDNFFSGTFDFFSVFCARVFRKSDSQNNGISMTNRSSDHFSKILDYFYENDDRQPRSDFQGDSIYSCGLTIVHYKAIIVLYSKNIIDILVDNYRAIQIDNHSERQIQAIYHPYPQNSQNFQKVT